MEEGEEGEEGEEAEAAEAEEQAEAEEEEEEEVWEDEAQRRMRDEGAGARYTPLRVNFANVDEAEALLDECVAIRDRYAEFGDERMKPPVLPDWLAEFNLPEPPDDSQWWLSLGDTNLMALAEVRQLRGDWGGAINELENLAEFQNGRKGADPREKLFVLGKLTDLARRHDLLRAIWPLERTLDVLRGEVRRPPSPSRGVLMTGAAPTVRSAARRPRAQGDGAAGALLTAMRSGPSRRRDGRPLRIDAAAGDGM